MLDINKGIIGHHRLVHTVEGEQTPTGTEERAFVDAKFVAMHTCAVGNLTRTVKTYLMLDIIRRAQEEIPVARICLAAACCVKLVVT